MAKKIRCALLHRNLDGGQSWHDEQLQRSLQFPGNSVPNLLRIRVIQYTNLNLFKLALIIVLINLLLLFN